MRRFVPAIFGLVLLAACGSSGDPSQSAASVRTTDAPGSSTASPTELPSPSADASADASAQPGSEITVDGLARTTVGGLSVRTEPSTGAELLGALPPGAATFVLAGPTEADGYTWYQLAGIGSPTDAECIGESLGFHCTLWVGWAAGSTADGDVWLERLEVDCPAGRDTAAYVSLDAARRLACAGNEEWRLVAYLAPLAQGRGCFPVWLVDPFWMDRSCGLFFPQPVEREFDEDTSIQAFIPPELGECGPAGCPFDNLKGSWVEIVGHLDDPIAETCTPVLNESIPEAPYDPPDGDLIAFTCRLNFVVTEVTETAPPAS